MSPAYRALPPLETGLQRRYWWYVTNDPHADSADAEARERIRSVQVLVGKDLPNAAALAREIAARLSGGSAWHRFIALIGRLFRAEPDASIPHLLADLERMSAERDMWWKQYGELEERKDAEINRLREQLKTLQITVLRTP